MECWRSEARYIWKILTRHMRCDGKREGQDHSGFVAGQLET